MCYDIKWALTAHSDTTNADTVVEIALQKGLIPAMRDVKVDNEELQEGGNRMKRQERRRKTRSPRVRRRG